ncbi:MAG TPA: molybdopterin molybdotransferase MoeA [Burkholderiaceae bacterium]|nr:molybdopterin molybdotransferase MoeA [Burkholderiaceae bacterium]
MKTIDQIAAELAGYDPTSLRADKVNAFLAELVNPIPVTNTDTETVPLFDALGRVLAQDVISPISVPPHDNSAMDGFAFDGAQLQDGRALQLTVIGTALAGAAWQGAVRQGECVKIMTGAIMPQGLNTVVPQEMVSVTAQTEAAATISIAPNTLRLGDNRRFAGEDLMQGKPALSQGDTLTPAALGLIASLGLPSVTVFRRLRVAYFSTGDEILSLGEAPREGAVYDSNRYTVFGLLRRMGCEVIDMGVVRDDPVQLEAAFIKAANSADAVITSGGVSVGEADYTRAMMKKLGAVSGGVAFWRIAMRPGRPMAVGRISAKNMIKSDSSQHNNCLGCYENDSAVLFGLPGNPVAVMVTFLAFVRPALLRMMGANAKPLPLLKAASLEPIRKKPGRTEYQRGIVTTQADGTLTVQTTGNQGSGVLSSMAQANGLIVLHHDQGSVNTGDTVDVMMFEGVI